MRRMSNIGIVLSGGGFRALAFHLGTLTWLDRQGYWDRISYLSTVSGGSLAIAAVFAANSGAWPKPGEFTSVVLPRIKRLLVDGKSLQRGLIQRLVLRPWLLAGSRAALLAQSLEAEWGLRMSLKELPDVPIWRINCTCFETGKNWRFSKEKMGDYKFGYSLSPNFAISEAVAASAGFPGLIGPLAVSTTACSWQNRNFGEDGWHSGDAALDVVHLWDGGVYENLGLEPVFKKGVLQHGIKFLIVSDAGKPPSEGFVRRHWFVPWRVYRLLEVAMEQVRGLRSREIVSHFVAGKSGIYVQLGRCADDIARAAKKESPVGEHLTAAQCRSLATMNTHLRRLSNESFEALVRHGEEVARVTYASYITLPTITRKP
jgi:NTE family protein